MYFEDPGLLAWIWFCLVFFLQLWGYLPVDLNVLTYHIVIVLLLLWDIRFIFCCFHLISIYWCPTLAGCKSNTACGIACVSYPYYLIFFLQFMRYIVGLIMNSAFSLVFYCFLIFISFVFTLCLILSFCNICILYLTLCSISLLLVVQAFNWLYLAVVLSHVYIWMSLSSLYLFCALDWSYGKVFVLYLITCFVSFIVFMWNLHYLVCIHFVLYVDLVY